METQQVREPSSEISSGVRRWILRGLFAKLFVGLVLFLSAGRLDWGAGWVYLGVFIAFDLATLLVVWPRHPALLAERSEIQAGTKAWDQVVLRLTALYLPMASWIVAGLNERWGWSPEVSLPIQVAAGVVTAAGYSLVVWAMGANAYFSATVRLQTDRDQKVVSSGPYAIVRHPGYVGAMLFTAAAPLLLGSVWALIPGLIAALLYVVRTELEDRTLKAELPGYRGYAATVRYRLVPGLW
jgi:protein-S-isoprenylcysteine O-methyltransferase Ste14